MTKSTSYAYNFHGGATSITYPSGRTITYTYNAADQTTSASDVSNGITYASNAHYAAPGHLSSLQESGSNIISTMYYNNRLQPCRISVKSSGTAPSSCTDSTNIGNVLDFTYSFTSNSANNGNVISITNNRNTARSQSFTYDELNRIHSAQSQATSGTYSWGLTYGYDPWANLLSETLTQGSASTLSVTTTWKNQISSTNGFAYDAAGNMTSDPTNSYTFNAEGELTSAAGVAYTFDGDGSRVQKATINTPPTPPTPYKLYWYGVGSDPLAESDASGTLSAEYIFMGGARIAMLTLPAATVNYYVADHLGSSRVVTDSSGAIQDDSDFLPFGEERSYSSASGNHYKFTGKERDPESASSSGGLDGLDDFAARFYTSRYGRFISADESKYSKATDPQTWNLYTYVANNPINAVDPTGHDPRGGPPGRENPIEYGGGGTGEGAIGMHDYQIGVRETQANGFDPWEDAEVAAREIEEDYEALAEQDAAAQKHPDGISVARKEPLKDCGGCEFGGIKIAITYQLMSGNDSVAAEGYVFQEILSEVHGSARNPSTQAAELLKYDPAPKDWRNIGPKDENGRMIASNAGGRFTDAPLGYARSGLITATFTQKLRAISPNGEKINLGTNKIKIEAGKPGHGTIWIDNSKMNIHEKVER